MTLSDWLTLPPGTAGLMLGPVPLAVVVILVVMVTATITDLRERRVPLWLTLGGTVLGLLLAGLQGGGTLIQGLIGMMVGLLLLLPFVLLGGIGWGDALLLGVVGTWLGWAFVLWTVCWGSMAGGVLALIALARHQRTLPYVPALAIGAIGAAVRPIVPGL